MNEAWARIAVELPSARYDAIVGDGALAGLGSMLELRARGRRVAVVTDSDVRERYGGQAVDSLEAAGFEVSLLSLPPGEQTKSWEQAGLVLEWLASVGLDRTDTLVALGGGVVGDLAGFCAAVYLRGIAFAQVPTTLLAQVDSSIGGKTAVDLSAGKNLAGAFIQPLCVVADTATLLTLPEIEWLSGLGEVAKSAVLDGPGFLSWLEEHAVALRSREPAAVAEAVQRCIAFKAAVVASDEHESGPREALNLGHTLGHAVEKVAGYGTVPHGLAVAEGMRFSLRLAVQLEGVEARFLQRVDELLDRMGLTRLEDTYDSDALRLAMSSDKKARGGAIRFVLPLAPGSHTVRAVDEDVLAKELDAFHRQKEWRR